MIAQLELELRKSKSAFDESHVATMIAKLKAGATLENRGWLTTTDLGARSWSEKRDIREIKALAKGRIVSWPGSPGYKPAEDCTLDEIAHCRRAVVSQVREMLTNVRLIERAAHSRIAA